MTYNQELKFLLDNNYANIVFLHWGKGDRKFLHIDSKKYMFNENKISKVLTNKIFTYYIHMKDINLKEKSINKIIGAFHKRIKLKIDKTETSFDGKVKSVKVIPRSIGKNQYGNIKSLIDNSFMVARRTISNSKKYRVYCNVEFRSQKRRRNFFIVEQFNTF